MKPSPSLSLTAGIQSFPSTINEQVVGPLLQKSEEGIFWHTQLTCTRSFAIMKCLNYEACAVLCHHSPRQIFLTFGQDPLYSRWQPWSIYAAPICKLLEIYTPGLITPPIHFTSGQILLLSEPSHLWVTSSAHPHQPSSIKSVHQRAS